MSNSYPNLGLRLQCLHEGISIRIPFIPFEGPFNRGAKAGNLLLDHDGEKQPIEGPDDGTVRFELAVPVLELLHLPLSNAEERIDVRTTPRTIRKTLATLLR